MEERKGGAASNQALGWYWAGAPARVKHVLSTRTGLAAWRGRVLVAVCLQVFPKDEMMGRLGERLQDLERRQGPVEGTVGFARALVLALCRPVLEAHTLSRVAWRQVALSYLHR